MIFYGKDIKGSTDFTTNTKFKSLLLGLKDIDKVDNLAIGLSMMSMILRFYYVNNEFSDKCLMSRTSMILQTNNKNQIILFRGGNVGVVFYHLPPQSSPTLRYCILASKGRSKND